MTPEMEKTQSLIGDEQFSQTERAQMCRNLSCGVASLHQMLEDLMDMARLEAAEDPRHIVTFDAGQMLTELCSVSQVVAVASGLALNTEGPATLTVEGDLVKTRRIAQNLIINAVKYTTQGAVTVTWGEHDGKTLLLRVEDSGPGFVEGAPAAAGQAHGEGVGLSIIKRLCELLEATIKVDSRPGVGTTVTVHFPLSYNHRMAGS